MCNYSSAKLGLLALKWVVIEKCHNYLLGLKFHVYTDNNPLAYVRESKLGIRDPMFKQIGLVQLHHPLLNENIL